MRSKKKKKTPKGELLKNKDYVAIHDDIVRQVLVRLPVKSVLRFKAVCKSWRALISDDPDFIRSHLNLANKHDKVSCLYTSGFSRFSLVETTLPKDDVKEVERGYPCYCYNYYIMHRKRPWYVHLTSILNRREAALEVQQDEFYYPFEYPTHRVKVLGSCNGLILVEVLDDQTFLWNPSIREHKMLSQQQNHLWHDEKYISGLGYDSLLDEYKAVIFVPNYRSRERYHYEIKSKMFTFSSRTGYWKEVDYDPPLNYTCTSYNSIGLTVNGAPHWVVNDHNEYEYDGMRRIIVYFDVVDEKFKRVPTPASWQLIYKSGPVNVSVSGGGLCAVHQVDVGHFDVWAMKEYGVEESCIKLFSVSHGRAWNWMVPLIFPKNGEEVVLQIDWRKVVSYNLKTKKEKLIIEIARELEGFKLVGYVESLVSPCWCFGTKEGKEAGTHGEKTRKI